MVFVSSEFRRQVFLHLYLNATALPGDSTPLFLLISGAPGEGKTFQLQHCLHEFDIDRHDLDSTAVEDPSAGRPDREIIRRFEDAAKDIRRTCRPACIVMEDVHLLLGRYDITQYTMNLQHVISQLMLFADKMSNTEVSSRVPVFMTANDTTVLEQPLIRHGRAKQFSWAPSPEERLAILAGILPELDPREILSLSEEYADKPVSFFAQLRQEIYYDFFSDVIVLDNPALRLRQAVERGSTERMRIDVSLDLLSRAAKRLAEDAKGGTFLAVRP
jgi:SpoVK/Ycf46/Vps4 family AAA+-type ATPase